MRKKRKIIRLFTNLGLILILFGIVYSYRTEIVTFYLDTFVNANRVEPTISEADRNIYYTGASYNYVQHTDSFKPKNKQDLLNIFYTVLDSGLDEFSFYCDEEYDSCLEEFDYIANNAEVLSYLNNFVHPYNSFEKIETAHEQTKMGSIIIRVQHTYTEEDINLLNSKIDEIYNTLIVNLTTEDEKIRTIHDYIIDNSIYDKEKSDNKISNYDSSRAIGPLLQGYGICGGYADAASILLYKCGIKNIRVSSENHIWNLINIDNNWLHMDVTWDDPVNANNTNSKLYDYYLIDYNELNSKEGDSQHIFNKDVFKEGIPNTIEPIEGNA